MNRDQREKELEELSELENKRRVGRQKQKGNYFFLVPIPMIL